MISVKIDKKNETVRYSTIINVDGKFVSISVVRLLYYAKPYQLDHSISLPKDMSCFIRMEKKLETGLCGMRLEI